MSVYVCGMPSAEPPRGWFLWRRADWCSTLQKTTSETISSGDKWTVC